MGGISAMTAPLTPRLLTGLLLIWLLTACGGGGGGGGGNNNPLPAISVTDSSITEGNTGNTDLNFTVTLSTSSNQTVSVNYNSSNGSAQAGSDYTSTAGTLTFNSGETSKTIAILVTGDTDIEPNETLTLTLSAVVNASLANTTATGTIQNDDGINSGLPARPSNTTCIAPARPASGAAITLNNAFPNLNFSLPLQMLQAPNNPNRWYVVEKGGTIRYFNNNTNATTSTLFANISARVDSTPNEAGLLGMAFDPNFASNGYVYLSYTRTGTTGPLTSYISRFQSPDNGQTLTIPAANLEQVILTVEQPFSNHNGGNIAFGPDGFLYIGLGDGGSGGDPQGHGQNTSTLLGSLLRVDIRVTTQDWANGIRYYIPPANPFAANNNCNGSGCAEIYAWGLRNPWRWSFDTATGDLWLGDVGQVTREEIDLVKISGNYGWNLCEGTANYLTGSCNTPGITAPVVDYSRSNGNCSVTGGYVYRGSRIPGLQGEYIYGDFCSGRIWSLRNGAPPVIPTLLTDSALQISSFAQGQSGEVYVLNYGAGTIFRIDPLGGNPGTPIPTQLSATGCVSSSDPAQPASGMIAYDINAPFWSDGAQKQRWLAIPDGTTITINNTHDWDFPIGSVLMKHFRLAGILIETRLFMRHTDGSWAGYSYEWDNAQSDATLVNGGKSKLINGQNWLYPSSSQCDNCHTTVAGFALGPETAQMNRNFTYPGTGVNASQLITLESIGLFSAPLGDIPANLPALANPANTNASLRDRSRSYLHTNCAQCHVPGGPTPANINLDYRTADANMNVCNLSPIGGDLGIANAVLIAPADPASSIIWQRMRRRDVFAMPPLASSLIDTSGEALLQSWINGMNSMCL